VLFALLLAACGPKPEDDQFVRSFFDQVQRGEFEAAQRSMGASLQTPDATAQLALLRRDYIPAQAPSEPMRINWSFNSVLGGDHNATFVHRYDYPDRVLIVTTIVRTPPGGPPTVEGFHINVTERSPELDAAGAFSFEGKSTAHLAFFAALICSVLAMLIAFVGVIATKGFKRKWLFAIIALLGAPVFLMNWTTGEWAPQLAFGLINTGVTKGLAPLDSWIVKFHIPIGALVVLSLLVPRWLSKNANTGDAA